MRTKWIPITAITSLLGLAGLAMPAASAADQAADVNVPTTRQTTDARAFPMLQRVRAAVAGLGLDEVQKQKIDLYFDQAQSDLQQIRDESSGNRKDDTRKSRQVFNGLRQNIAAQLDDRQKAALQKKLQPARKDLFSRINSAVQTLQLTEDQQRQIVAILQDAQRKLQDAGDKAQSTSAELQSLLKDTPERLGKVLTDEQKRKLLELLRPSADDHTNARDAQPKDGQ